MNLKKCIYVLLSTILVVPILLTGCGGKEQTDLTTQEILTNTLTATQKITSYQTGYDMAIDMDIVGGKQAMKMNMDGTGTGAMDITNKKMQMLLDINAEIPGTGSSQVTMKMSMAMYMVDGWMYTQMTIPMSGEQWTKMKVEGNEVSQDQLGQLAQMLKTTTQTTLRGTEKVGSIDCYVLEVVPNLKDLWNFAMSQQGGALNEGIDVSQYDLSKLMKSFSLNYWISKKDFNIIKGETNLDMNIDAETVGASTEDFESMTMVLGINMTFSNYNKPVDIQLPAEAATAEEVSE